MILPLVHAKRKTDVMIPSARQHTQGIPPMKDGTARQHHTRRLGSVRLATLALLLPLALASTAQTSGDASRPATQAVSLAPTSPAKLSPTPSQSSAPAPASAAS